MSFRKLALFYWVAFYLAVTVLRSQQIGPVNEEVDISQFNHVIYVMSGQKLSLKNNADRGSRLNPFTSINEAVLFANKITKYNEKTAILVASGNYEVSETMVLSPNIHLYGGFSDDGVWQRDIFNHPTYLIGVGDKRIIILSESTKIDGFVISGARFRGKGAAVYISSASAEISNNIFINNGTLSPKNWKPKYLHQQANDGGAICVENYASPIIRNNLFVDNKTETGRGAAIAVNNYCSPQIIGNVFIGNISGLNDPMRSSDGAAISLFNWCSGIVANNIFISNSAISKNDGGAIFTALWCSPVINGNIFVNNKSDDDGGAIFIGGQEHRYDRPFDPIPPEDKFYVKVINNLFIYNKNITPKKNNPDGAVRFTMNVRGEFIGNIFAHNSGLQFQNSHVKLSRNIILDNLSLVQSGDEFCEFVLTDNILLEPPKLNAQGVDSSDNVAIIKDGVNFIDDSFEIKPISAKFNPNTYTTILVVDMNNRDIDLVNRVVNYNSKWSVIKKSGEDYIELWGDFSDALYLYILPTYKYKIKTK